MPDTYNWDTGLLLNPQTFPKIASEYQLLLDAGDFPKLEDLLMERLDTSPQDVPFYLPAYRAFIRKQDTNRALAIIGLHIESLKTRGDLVSEISLRPAPRPS